MQARRWKLGVAITAAAVALSTAGVGAVAAQDEPQAIRVMSSNAEDAVAFNAVLDAFTAATGIPVINEASPDFEVTIQARAGAGDPPDVAIFPQPGLMRDFEDQLVDLSTILDMDAVRDAFGDGIVELGLSTDGERFLGLDVFAVNKSIVWYNPMAFEAAGYEVPSESWDDVLALADQIVADGGNPFCVSMESSTATGWVGTDYIENFMLRTNPPEVYDQWTRGEIPFSDPRIKAAWEAFGQMVHTPDYVYGGAGTMLSTPWPDGGAFLFTDPPSCYMWIQGSFATASFPEDVQADMGNLAGYFTVPPVDPEYGAPLVVVGELVSMFKDSPEARAFVEWYGSPDMAVPRAESGETLVYTNRNVPDSVYPDQFWKDMAQLVLEADVFRYDGSDLMPGAVGTGSFWKGVVDYIQDPDALDSILATIDESWPED